MDLMFSEQQTDLFYICIFLQLSLKLLEVTQDLISLRQT